MKEIRSRMITLPPVQEGATSPTSAGLKVHQAWDNDDGGGSGSDDDDVRKLSFAPPGITKAPPCSYFSSSQTLEWLQVNLTTLNKSVPLLWNGIPPQFRSESLLNVS